MSANSLPVACLPALAPHGLSQYLSEIKKFPILSNEAEFALAKRWRDDGDVEAAHQLVTSHLRLVVKIARRYQDHRISIADLISEGNIGLMRAVQKFDPDKGFRLATYAIWWIKAAIRAFVLRSMSVVRLGSNHALRQLVYSLPKEPKWYAAAKEGNLSQRDLEAISRHYDIPVKTVEAILHQISTADISLNAPVAVFDDDEAPQFIDYVEDGRETPEDSVLHCDEIAYQRRIIGQALDQLDERERDIVENRWLRDETLSLQTLAKRYNVSRERVRQIEKRALKKIRRSLEPFGEIRSKTFG